MAIVRASRARTYQGLPSEPVRPRGLARVDRVAGGGSSETVRVRWDTRDLRLLAHGGALEQGVDGGWTLTVPGGVEHAAGTAGAEPPAELVQRVRAYVGGRPLQPVLRLATRTERSLLLDRDGNTLAELDRGTTQAESLTGPGRIAGWSRTEVRLAAGRPRLLTALDQRLRAQGLTEVPAARTGHAVAHPRSAGAALTRYLRDRSAELFALDGAVRREEADSVHRMRVCARRLRSALTGCRRWLREAETAPVAAELHWLGGVLGTARDAETMGERLSVEPAVHDWFDDRYAEAYAMVRELLDSERYFALLEAVERLADRPPLRGRARRGRRELARLLRAERRRTGQRLLTALAMPAGAERDEALHAARKAAKRARYLAELAGADRAARQLRPVQEALGDYQDAVVARRLVLHLTDRARAAGQDTFGLGRLFAREESAGAAALAAAGPAWRTARRRANWRL
ncbi:CHAD domain-containing protein [Kitasatospora sp. NPDC058965]|uniref:CYTH and CHAD domain-containing protein n=1 Tax=Kitasatospora sp. NPDC058965 TaxID=3346682 RepID=UPI0036C0445F